MSIMQLRVWVINLMMTIKLPQIVKGFTEWRPLSVLAEGVCCNDDETKEVKAFLTKCYNSTGSNNVQQ